MKKNVKIALSIIAIIIVAGLVLAYNLNLIPHKKYSNADFGISQYESHVDADSDGIDDQTDILNGVKKYLSTKPKYKSKYYATGYPDDEYGVCTDVVLNGLLEAGYDLQLLMSDDITQHPERYRIDTPDKNIDFRRVVNMNVYLKNNAISLTTDVNEISEWQAGDIVVWAHHVGIISDNRNAKGIPYVLHHASPRQTRYEEDVLSTFGEIIGHYRIS